MRQHTIPHIGAMLDYGTSLLTVGDKFLLSGNLGAGKTTLTKGIAAGLGIHPDQVQSPTYTYLHIYEEKLLHIDMRRIESDTQLHQLGILDLIDQYPYVVIERPKWTASYADHTWLTIDLIAPADGSPRTAMQTSWTPTFQTTHPEIK